MRYHDRLHCSVLLQLPDRFTSCFPFLSFVILGRRGLREREDEMPCQGTVARLSAAAGVIIIE